MLTVAALAFLLEGLVEYVIGSWWKPGEKATRERFIPALNLALGIALAILLKVDLFVTLGLAAGLVGQVVTGIVIGRGSQYLHTFFLNFLSRAPRGN